MADEIVIKLKLDLRQAERDLKEFGIKAERVLGQPREALGRFTKDANAATLGVNSLRSAINPLTVAFAAATGTVLAAGVALKKFAEISIQAAVEVNKQINLLKALTGSAAAAEKRFAALFALAQKTPGLTTSLAATLDAQLRIFNVAERTIDRLLPVIGRLNAITPFADPRQFVNNLTQLISGNFDREDLKELARASPIAGNLIKEIFNVDNPTNAEAIRASAKRLGVTTVERLAEELIKAGATNSALKNATESFAGQFEKLQDRITVALAPIGDELLRVLLPTLKELVTILERELPKITGLLKNSREELLVLASAFISVANAVGSVVTMLSLLDQQFGIVRALAGMATMLVNPGALGTTLATFDAMDAARASDNRRRASLKQTFGPFGDIDSIVGFLGTPTRPRVRPPGIGGGGGGGGAADAARREREREIKDLLKKRAEFQADFREQDIKDFNELNQALQEALVEEETRLQGAAGRPARLAGFAAASAERIAAIEARDAELARNTAKQAAEELAKLPPILSDSERFMKGFADATLSVGDAFERFGSDVARAFTNVKSLFDGLKRAVLDFFNNLVGSALQNLVRGTLGSLFNGRGGGGGGVGGFFQQAFAGGGGGGGISVPPSVSGGLLGRLFGGGGVSGAPAGLERVGDPFAASQFNLSLGGGGGGLLAGIGAAAPFLGATLGAGLGGRSIGGQILGGIGGALGGLVFGAATGGITGGLGSAFALSGALGPAALVAAPLLIAGAVLLGRAKQRRSDEEAAGELLTQALAGIEQLAAAVGSGQVTTLGEARTVFDTQILTPFRQQIGQLKTRSVRESRLSNQVRDLENVYQARIPPLIAEQEVKRADAARAAAIDRRLIPEFATGGVHSRGGLALLHPGEMVLTQMQQATIALRHGADVFGRAGVPGVQANARFDNGGIFAGSPQAPIVIENLNVSWTVGTKEATRVVVAGGNTEEGRSVTVKNVKVARTNREL